MPLQAIQITDAEKNKEQLGAFNRDPYEQWDNIHQYMQAFFSPSILQIKKPCLKSTSNPRKWQFYNVKSILVWIKPNPALYTYTGTACHIWEGWGASASMLLVEQAVSSVGNALLFH